MFLLLFTANGIFEPLEVALNRAWGVTQNRSYCQEPAGQPGTDLCVRRPGAALPDAHRAEQPLDRRTSLPVTIRSRHVWVNLLVFKLAALPVSILALFLVYWLLPNRTIEPKRVAPVAIVVGLALEALKYVNLLVSPMLTEKLNHEYDDLSALRHDPAVDLRRFA